MSLCIHRYTHTLPLVCIGTPRYLLCTFPGKGNPFHMDSDFIGSLLHSLCKQPCKKALTKRKVMKSHPHGSLTAPVLVQPRVWSQGPCRFVCPRTLCAPLFALGPGSTCRAWLIRHQPQREGVHVGGHVCTHVSAPLVHAWFLQHACFLLSKGQNRKE